MDQQPLPQRDPERDIFNLTVDAAKQIIFFAATFCLIFATYYISMFKAFTVHWTAIAAIVLFLISAFVAVWYMLCAPKYIKTKQYQVDNFGTKLLLGISLVALLVALIMAATFSIANIRSPTGGSFSKTSPLTPNVHLTLGGRNDMELILPPNKFPLFIEIHRDGKNNIETINIKSETDKE